MLEATTEEEYEVADRLMTRLTSASGDACMTRNTDKVEMKTMPLTRSPSEDASVMREPDAVEMMEIEVVLNALLKERQQCARSLLLVWGGSGQQAATQLQRHPPPTRY